jgi:hypothetical protein
MKYVILKGIEEGNRFFTTNTPGYDHTKLVDGTVAYHIIGYANTVAEAQIKLYGKSYVNHQR